jgi:predicted RNA-binding protein with TRAM domain
MELPDQLLSLFSAQVEKQADSYVIEIPKREFQLGDLHTDRTYRVAILSTHPSRESGEEDRDQDLEREQDVSGPPVAEGDTREVEIEDIGDQGDGITRVEQGYVVIVPDTELGERVTIKITEVRENMPFAEVIERGCQR